MASEPLTDSGEDAAGDDVGRLPAEIVFRPMRSRNLFEETFARLNQAIQLGVVQVGERFPTERELSERLEVSRITIREAFRALEQADLVEIKRGRHGGAYVLQNDVRRPGARAQRLAREMGAELDSFLDYRRAVEPAIAELAAERRTDQQLATATDLLEESEQVAIERFRGADSRFHLSLAAMAGSPPLTSAAADIQLQFSDILAALAIPLIVGSRRHSQEQHRAILDAVSAGDSAAAHATMLEHVEGTAVIFRSLG